MATKHDDARTSRFSQHRVVVLPDMPPGDPPLQHDAIQYKQTVDALLAGHSLLGVMQGEYPPRAKSLKENFPLDMLPPLDATAPNYARQLESRMVLEIENRRNDRLRDQYMMEDRTTGFVAIYTSALANHPEFARDLLELCDLTPHGLGEWLDGPRSYGLMVHKLVHGGERKKTDKKHYVLALRTQEDHKLPEGCSAADYDQKARAYYERILPNLPYSVDPLDAMEYLLDMMPALSCGSDARRLNKEFRDDGSYTDLDHVRKQCKEIVEAVQRPGVKSTSANLASHALTASELQDLQLTCGIAITSGGRRAAALADLGTPALAAGDLASIGCPHGTDCKFGDKCHLNLSFDGPANANMWANEKRRKDTLAERAAWAKKNDVKAVTLKAPPKSELDAAKKRAEKWKADRARTKTTAAGLAETTPAGLAASFPGGIQDLDDPSFGATANALAASPGLPVDLGGFTIEQALAVACEQRNGPALRALLADGRCCEASIPLPEVTAKGPWDRYILGKDVGGHIVQKTIDGRVARWYRDGNWVANNRLSALTVGGWYVQVSQELTMVLQIDAYAEAASFGQAWLDLGGLHGGESMVPPECAIEVAGAAPTSAADVDQLYQSFYPVRRSPLFAPDGTSLIVAGLYTISVVAVVRDINVPTHVRCCFPAVDDETAGETAAPLACESDDDTAADDEPPPRLWLVAEFPDLGEAHLVCVSADAPEDDLTAAMADLPAAAHGLYQFGDDETAARAELTRLVGVYASAPAPVPTTPAPAVASQTAPTTPASVAAAANAGGRTVQSHAPALDHQRALARLVPPTPLPLSLREVGETGPPGNPPAVAPTAPPATLPHPLRRTAPPLSSLPPATVGRTPQQVAPPPAYDPIGSPELRRAQPTPSPRSPAAPPVSGSARTAHLGSMGGHDAARIAPTPRPATGGQEQGDLRTRLSVLATTSTPSRGLPAQPVPGPQAPQPQLQPQQPVQPRPQPLPQPPAQTQPQMASRPQLPRADAAPAAAGMAAAPAVSFDLLGTTDAPVRHHDFYAVAASGAIFIDVPHELANYAGALGARRCRLRRRWFLRRGTDVDAFHAALRTAARERAQRAAAGQPTNDAARPAPVRRPPPARLAVPRTLRPGALTDAEGLATPTPRTAGAAPGGGSISLTSPSVPPPPLTATPAGTKKSVFPGATPLLLSVALVATASLAAYQFSKSIDAAVFTGLSTLAAVATYARGGTDGLARALEDIYLFLIAHAYIIIGIIMMVYLAWRATGQTVSHVAIVRPAGLDASTSHLFLPLECRTAELNLTSHSVVINIDIELITPSSPTSPPPPSPPPSPPPQNTTAIAMVSELPRDDIFTYEQSRSLYLEMLAGNEPPEELPPGLRCLCIGDTGCGTSMGNDVETQFEPNSVYKSKTDLAAAGGSLTCEEKAHMRYPLTTSRGPGFWRERDSIVNRLCPYVLLALGRASIEKGLSMWMPAWGEDGYFAYPNGVKVVIHNRHVLVVRPIGYKVNPARTMLAAIVSPADLGVPTDGDFAFYLGSGDDRPGDIQSWLKSTIPVVCVDKCRGGVAHDCSGLGVSRAIVEASSWPRCRFVFVSFGCNTFSVLHYLPDAQGRPGRPYRDIDHPLGFQRADGTRPPIVEESNATIRCAAEAMMACFAHGGEFGAETPAHRRAGTPDAMPGCEKHACMYDTPSFKLLIASSGAEDITIDQCEYLDSPAAAHETGPKATSMLFSPGLLPLAEPRFRGRRCTHARGTHKAIRGANASGTYMSVGTQRYSARLCEAIAGVFRDWLADTVQPGTVSALVAGVIQGKRLVRHGVTDEFFHQILNHSEHRVCKHILDAWCDAEPWWSEYMTDGPCGDCLLGDAPALGPTGSLPQDDGLMFVDMWFCNVPSIHGRRKCRLVSVRPKTKMFKSIPLSKKSDGADGIEHLLAHYNSMGCPVSWIHCDQANDLRAGGVTPLAKKHSIRITTNVAGQSRHNGVEPYNRTMARGARILLKQGRLPLDFREQAEDYWQEGQGLKPSRTPPHDCALGRTLTLGRKDGTVVKPPGSHRRPFACLCVVSSCPRHPGGTLANKMKQQGLYCLHMGYGGGRCGSYERLGVEKSSPAYICYYPELNTFLHSEDVRFIPWCMPGLQRTAGGGWCIPRTRIPFSTEALQEKAMQKQLPQTQTPPQTQSGGRQTRMPPPTLPTQPSFQNIDDIDLEQTAPVDVDFDYEKMPIEYQHGFPPEEDEPPPAPGLPAPDPIGADNGTAAEQSSRDKPKPPVRRLVPAEHWPDYECREYDGLGWLVNVTERTKNGKWVKCEFVKHRDANGQLHLPVWRRPTDLLAVPGEDLDESLSDTTPTDSAAEPAAKTSTAEPTPAPAPAPAPDPEPEHVPEPEPDGPTPNADTVPHQPGADPLQEPARPVRARAMTDRYRPEMLAARYVEAAGAGYEPTAACGGVDSLSTASPMPAALYVNVHQMEHRFAQLALAAFPGEEDAEAAAAEASAAFSRLDEMQQRAACILADHTLFATTYGTTSPQARTARETYAAARLDAACHGIEVPNLDPTLDSTPPPRSDEGALLAMALSVASKEVATVKKAASGGAPEKPVAVKNGPGLAFERSLHDPCVYTRSVGEGPSDQINLTMYVDDGRLYWGTSNTACKGANSDVKGLHDRFGVKLGPVDPEEDYFLGANRFASKARDVVTITATSYIDAMDDRYLNGKGSESSKQYPAAWSYLPADSELERAYDEACQLRQPASPELFTRYNSKVGSLRHAVKYRPDICAAMDLLGCCLTFPTERLDRCADHCMVYLVRTRQLGVTYSKNAPNAQTLRCRADANWRAARSTSGYHIDLGGACVAACCRRQGCISMSTTEAELVALADCAIELLYVMSVLRFIGYDISGPVSVETDNKGAYDLCHRYSSAQHTRHIDRKLFKMRELRGARLVDVKFVPTDDNSADMFTKILTRQPFEKHRRTVMNLGVSAATFKSVARTRESVTPAAACLSMDGAGPINATLENVFDDRFDGHWLWFAMPCVGFALIAAVAKAKTSPDIFSERQMRGPEWDEAKTVEVETLRKMGAFTPIAADDAQVKGWRVVETMWTGRVKRKADRSVEKYKGRAVLRGDIHKAHYSVDANQATAPVVRNTSMSIVDAVSALCQWHVVSFDCPSAYLQGQQRSTERVLARAPVGHRVCDERGVELYWFMNNPLYGQLDAGAIWNRTFNEFVTRDGPKVVAGSSSTHSAAIEVHA